MKRNLLKNISTRKNGWALLTLGLVAVALAAFGGNQKQNLVVHEWGTFTSVQGGDGELISWQPLQTADLPTFVYDWSKPGSNRQCASLFGSLGKGLAVTLVRMETPVIYFYSDTERRVDVSVEFPDGLITEWYPQASRIGPATFAPKPSLVSIHNAVHKLGFTGVNFASMFGQKPITNSVIEWKSIRVLPQKPNRESEITLPNVKSANHYFAARETDSALLEADSLSKTNPADEHEKFLFYRGVGNFKTPLKVTTSTDGKVTVENTGTGPLTHLFLLNIHSKNGAWTYLETLDAKEKKEWATVESAEHAKLLPQEQFQKEICAKMRKALANEGLFDREAEAMVKTWRESWFAEDGIRVLYVLPRAWTDSTLPMKLNPRPRELTRVMVGRAEIITPEMQRNLSTQLVAAKAGDDVAKQNARALLKGFGRFATAALQLTTKTSPETSPIGWSLLQTEITPALEKNL